VIGKTLGHTEAETTMIYARLGEDPVRKALEDHGRHLMEVIGKAPDGATVIKMDKESNSR